MFVHGIGFGLLPYISVIQGLRKFNRSVILVELPHISNRITNIFPSRENFVSTMHTLLNENNAQAGVFIGHSFGTTYVSWLLKFSPSMVDKAVFIDPVVFLFHSADAVRLNFRYIWPSHIIHCGRSRTIFYTVVPMIHQSPY